MRTKLMMCALLAASVPLSSCLVRPDDEHEDHDRGYVEGGYHEHDHDRHCDRDDEHCDHDR